jgi:hypothetical protein
MMGVVSTSHPQGMGDVWKNRPGSDRKNPTHGLAWLRDFSGCDGQVFFHFLTVESFIKKVVAKENIFSIFGQNLLVAFG